MITESDAQSTVELENCYIVEPIFATWDRRNFIEDGFPLVPSDFSYSSDNNTEWLDASQLKDLLKTTV